MSIPARLSRWPSRTLVVSCALGMITVGAAVLVVIVGIFAFKMLRKAL